MGLRKVTETPPRALEVATRDTPDAPIGRKSVDRRELARRMYNLSGEIATGRVPLDNTSAPIVADALEREYRKFRRGMK